MDYVDIDEELDRLRDGNWGLAVAIAEMADAFPDLRLFRDCWGNLKFCSAEANSEVDTMEMDSCHRCDGQPIKMWAYVVVDPNGTRLYSDPPYFTVADQNKNGFGEIPRVGWQEELEYYGISRKVIVKLKTHIAGHPPIDYFGDD